MADSENPPRITPSVHIQKAAKFGANKCIYIYNM